ncbi:MAG: endonuclease/exonuclease/phosphatase family protein, partial [Bacteroidota bacterium]
HQSVATNPNQEGARTLGSLAIFSKYPLKTVAYHKFNATHGYQIVDLEKGGQAFRLINIHLSSNQVTQITNELAEEGNLNEKETWSNIKEVASRYKNGAIRRSTQAELIRAKIEASRLPTIVCGDFNDTAQSYVYRTIKGDLQDTFVKKGAGFGSSYAGKIPALRIDYILSSSDVKILGSRRRSHYFSDHYAVEAVLEL